MKLDVKEEEMENEVMKTLEMDFKRKKKTRKKKFFSETTI